MPEAVAPVVPPNPAAVDPAAPPAAADPVAVDPAAPAADPAAPPAAAVPPWAQTRFDQLTREKHTERRAREAAEARATTAEQELVKLRAPAPAAGAPAAPAPSAIPPVDPNRITLTKDEMEARIQAEAQARAGMQSFNQRCDQVADLGRKEIPGFDAALKNFEHLGGLATHPHFVQAAIALDNGHKVLHHLAGDLNEASRILSLAPVPQAIEMAKLSTRLATAPAPSAAPAPVNPITGAGGPAVPGPDGNGEFKDQAAFRKWREQQKAARR